MVRTIANGIIAAALCLAASLPAYAAGLGRLTVLSSLGQPLNAEIEIVSLQPGEEEGLVARLGSSDAFKQAGIEYNPSLIGMRFVVERRDGRAFLRVTTLQAVNEPFLDMLVELQWNTGRLVREYTFLLDPAEFKKGPSQIAATPAPASKPAPAPVPAPVPRVEARPLGETPASVPAATPSAEKSHEVKKGDTLAAIARQHLSPGVSLNQMLIAIYRANQEAFIRDNINLVREGRILNIPAPELAGTIESAEAQRLVQEHMGEFAEYRRRLAAAPTAAESSAGRRDVAGRIETKPEAQPPAAAQDQLRLSKADPKKPAAAGSRAAREDDKASQDRAAKEAESRVTDLEKNVADLQKLLALKNQQLAEVEKKAGKPAAEAPKPVGEAPKPAAEAPKPAAETSKPAAETPKPAAEAAKPAAEAPKPAAETPKPAAEAPKPAAEAPKPAPKPAAPAAKAKAKAAPEPSLVDEFLDNPLALGGLVLVLLLLAGYGTWAWRRKKASQSKFQDSVLGAATGAGGPASVFGATAAATAATAVPSALSSPASAPVSKPAGSEAEEVDPIAEADVYMAYGRDAQAEEILKESLQKDPKRIPVLAKLLEIYANRRDPKSFEQHALKLKSLTKGAGPEWEKAAALGRSVDVQNGLYAGTAGAGTAALVASAPAPAAPTLDFDLGGAPAQSSAADISLDEPPKDPSASSVDFDLGAATTPAAAPAAQKSDTDFTPEGTLIMGATEAEKTVDGLDFDLSLGGDEKKPAPRPAPAAPAAPAFSDASGGLDFDLNLDLDTPTDKSGVAEKSAPAMDLSSISLDLGSAGEPSASSVGGGDPKWQEVATKLDLAKAYEEMGDKDGARELLNEVMKDGDMAQKGQAQQLLAKLG